MKRWEEVTLFLMWVLTLGILTGAYMEVNR